MAARSVRVLFKNLTDKPLDFVNEHLEHGIYTEPFFPPQTIAPDAVAEWRTESDGWLTGVEGHATYSISNGDGVEFVEVGFNNPYVGSNDSQISIKEDFSGNASKTFEGANLIDGAPPPNLIKMADGDVEAWIDGILAGPLYIFANASSANDANATFAIRRKRVSSPLLGPQTQSGPRSSQINTELKPKDWSGQWSGPGVAVYLSSLLVGKAMAAHILDTTRTPPLQVQENFVLGGHEWATNVFVTGLHMQFPHTGDGVVSEIAKAATASLSALPAGERDDVVSTAHSVVNDALKSHGAMLSEGKLATISKAAEAIGAIRRSTVMLSNGIALTLYDEFEGTQKTGHRLLYQRMNFLLGQEEASLWLSRSLDLR